MRVQQVEERLGEHRKVVVEPLVDARAQEREGLHHALDVWVLENLSGDREPTGHARVAAAEFFGVRAQEREFALVVGQQILHRPRPQPGWATAADDSARGRLRVTA